MAPPIKDAKKGGEAKKSLNKYGVWTKYEVKGGQLVRKNQWSPKQGPGFFMAEHKDRRTCGKSSYTEFKKKA